MPKNGRRRPDHRGMKRKKKELKRRGKHVPTEKTGSGPPSEFTRDLLASMPRRATLAPVPVKRIRRGQSR